MSGYFGAPCARRHERTPDPELNAPIPQTAECARCETQALLAGGKLPQGWEIVDGEAVCGDCRHVQSSTAAMMRQALDRRREDRSIGDSSPSRFRGCRVGHEIALGLAAIQIRAGATPPIGRDEAVQFLLDGHGLDELIIHLSAIRAELSASQTPGTVAREGGLNG